MPREFELALGEILEIAYHTMVTLRFSWPEPVVRAPLQRLGDSGHGLVVWLQADNVSHV